MAIYRTAQGRPLDMAQLAAKNETTRAVGNMNVNARGDTIDSNGKIIVPVTKKVGNRYQNTVKNASSNRATAVAAPKQANAPEVDAPVAETPVVTAPVEETIKTPIQPQFESAFEEMSEEDLEFLEPTDEDLEIEEIKKAELEAKSKKK